MLLENSKQTDNMFVMAELLPQREFSTEAEVARTLLESRVFSIDTQNGFIWSSGMRSPIYTDLRLLGSNVDVRTQTVDHLVSQMQKDTPDIVFGVATAGISWGTLVADRMRLPFAFVRPIPKDHGKKSQIEGFFVPGQNAIIVEDTISTGESSLSSIDALRKAGVNANKIFSIMDYQLPDSSEGAQKQDVEIYSLTTLPDITRIAENEGYWDTRTTKAIKDWHKDPHNWRVS